MEPTKRISYTVDEACREIGVSRTYFYALMADGAVKTFKMGRRRLVTRQELQSLIDRKAREGCVA